MSTQILKWFSVNLKLAGIQKCTFIVCTCVVEIRIKKGDGIIIWNRKLGIWIYGCFYWEFHGLMKHTEKVFVDITAISSINP